MSELSRPRLEAAATECACCRGSQWQSSLSVCGALSVCPEGVSLRFREKRCRREDRFRTSGGGAASRTGAEGGFGEGAGVYTCGFNIKSGSGSSTSDDEEESGGWTNSKAGSVSRVAGVMILGSEGRYFDIDNRICRLCSGGEAGGDAIWVAAVDVLNY